MNYRFALARSTLAGLCLASAALGADSLRLATTTSVENSGLLEHLLPAFEQAHGVRVQVIATGSGKALELAARGDVDVVLSHAPLREAEFLRRGAVFDAHPLMYNEFVLVGPPEDPARTRSSLGLVDSLRRIAEAQAPFFSRGDDSGTHEMEKTLWQRAGISPKGHWYRETGQGMSATLRIAHERRGYTLSDRATWAQFKGRGDSAILVEDKPPLRNVYSIMATSKQRHPHVRYPEARKLIEWLLSPEGQRRIAEFRPNGEVLFHPLARTGP